MSFYLWLIGAIVSAALLYTYRKWKVESQTNAAFRAWAWSIEQANKDAGKLLYEQLLVMAQLGEMFDHHGVALEQSQFTQESTDLKDLGRILRSLSLPSCENPWELTWCHNTIVVIADRYGIEPISSGPHSPRVLVRIAEAIMERVLVGHKQAVQRHNGKE